MNSSKLFAPILPARIPTALLRLSLLLVAILALGLAACGSATIAPPEEQPAEAAATPAAPAEEAAAAQPSGDRPAAALDPAARNGMYESAPEITIDPNAIYMATLNTAKGEIRIQLFADRSPVTVNNFVFLANQGFYDNTTFHRVLDGFMAQAGDPTGTGAGGPGYTFQDEFAPGLAFDRPGLLAMANAGPGTNGSQFFITFSPTEWLNGMHTIFGEVVEGNEVLNELTRRDPSQSPDFDGDLIESITIEELEESILPTPTPLPPTPTPFPPSSLESDDRPLADLAPEEKANYFNSAPEMVIDPAQSYQATITTTQGDIVVDLYADLAPMAVNNFVVLANLGFYDGTPINQINEQLMIIGSPDNQPTSDAGYKFEAEVGLDVTPTKGAVAYIPNQTSIGPAQSSSSQLLIALIDPPADANAGFSFFGQAVEGLEVLDSLTMADSIESVTIRSD